MYVSLIGIVMSIIGAGSLAIVGTASLTIIGTVSLTIIGTASLTIIGAGLLVIIGTEQTTNLVRKIMAKLSTVTIRWHSRTGRRFAGYLIV